MIKTLTIAILVGLLCVPFADAGSGFSSPFRYQDASDGDAGVGCIARCQYDLDADGSSFRFLLQAGYLTGFGGDTSDWGADSAGDAEIDIVPVEIGVLYDFAVTPELGLYVGVGCGYYMIDAEYSSDSDTNIDILGFTLKRTSTMEIDDGVGYFALLGLEQKIARRLAFVGEIQYTYLDVDAEVEKEFGFHYLGTTISENATTESLEVDLSGISASIGLSWTW